MNQKPLSIRQQLIFDFIVDELQERGYAPTVREIVQHVGDKSPTSVHRHLKTLESRGYLYRDANKSRSIRLTRSFRGIPLEGFITAGSPIQDVEQSERFDLSTMFDPANHFVLRVGDDSMAGDHIGNGDLIVIHRQTTCRNGDTVVAAVNGGKLALNRFYRDADGQTRFEPTDRHLHPPGNTQIEIAGVVVGVIRPAMPASV
ncbi:MAG: transcriptional repressor LexA [Planctomycetaceae bacterium]